MKLRDFSLEVSRNADVPKEPAFRCMAHHVAQLFLSQLPTRFDFDGSSKIEICFGPSGRREKYVCDRVFGVSVYYCEEFDLREFYFLDGAEQERRLLCEVRAAFVDMAQDDEAKIRIVNQAADAVIACGFSMRTYVKKLSRLSQCRKYRLSVFRVLNREVGESWGVEISLREDNQKAVFAWLQEPPGCLDMRPHFRSSGWEDHEFVISPCGMILRRLDPRPYYEQLESA